MDLEKLDNSLSGIKVSVGIHRKHKIPHFLALYPIYIKFNVNLESEENGKRDRMDIRWSFCKLIFFATRSFSTMNNCPFMKWFVKGGRKVGSVFFFT